MRATRVASEHAIKLTASREGYFHTKLWLVQVAVESMGLSRKLLQLFFLSVVLPFAASFIGRSPSRCNLHRVGRREALAKHVHDKILEIKERYIEITGFLATADLDEATMMAYREEKRSIQTVVESYQALDDIYRDLQTFEGVLEDPDPEEERLDEKDVATVFIKEFEDCRVSIETQLTKFVENGGVDDGGR